ncbi:MAG: hypothetical protein EXR69_02385 [Myxococcales bacterium]|nr:hypothetical protein [Myxococcales bacterium]
MLPLALHVLLSLQVLSPAIAAESGSSCAGTSTVAEFLAASAAGEAAFAEMDVDALVKAQKDGARALPCLAEPVKPKDAAAFHRMNGLLLFTRPDLAGALSEFHAARRLEPGYQIPESVAPQGHPLVALYDASASADEGELQPVQASGGGEILVDGVRTSLRPNGVSVIVQRVDALGKIENSLYLEAKTALPSWAIPPKAVSRRGLHAGFIAGTAGAAVVGGVTYGLALSAKGEFGDTAHPVPDSELPGLRERANTLTYASMGVGAVALALGTMTVVTW